MHSLFFLFLGILFTVVLLIAFSTHRVRILLFRENGVFQVKLQFLFYKRLLYDSRFPAEIKKINRNNLEKSLAKLKKKKYTHKRNTPFREALFYVRFVTALLALLGAENIPRVHLRLNKLILTLGSDDPMHTALLYGTVLNVYGQLISLSTRISSVRVSENAFFVLLEDAPYFDSDFDLTFSLPLFYYFQVFHSIVPDSDRVLTTLKKRKNKLKLRQK